MTLRVLTWNVQWFCGLDERIDLPRVLAVARDMGDFDVLCLQEVASHYPGLPGNADHDQPALLRELLPGFEVFYGAGVDELAADGKTRQRFGNLIASRLPVAQISHHPLPYPADARPGGVRSMPRIATVATTLTPLGPVRIMTSHLEYYSAQMRMAQAVALRELHAQACGHTEHPPSDDHSGGPFQSKTHTPHCILTGDFNFVSSADEYNALQTAQPGATQLLDAWTIAHPAQPHAPTFCLFDDRYSPTPITCDFIFVSDSLAPHVRNVRVNTETQASDHQPVLLELE